MKLWLLRIGFHRSQPWYDKAFGFVVRAETEAEARALVAQIEREEELEDGLVTRNAELAYAGHEGVETWSDPQHSTCVELKPEGATEVILRDFRSA